MQNSQFRDRCWLVRNNVPFNTVFETERFVMTDVMLQAMAIVFTELEEGSTFNFNTERFERE